MQQQSYLFLRDNLGEYNYNLLVNIIKLSAIDSTSRFLKDLSKNETLENFTTVVADLQTQGKGQRNTQWFSESKKNLLFTFYVDIQGLNVSFAPVLSFLVAVTLRNVIDAFVVGKGKVQIKWPNDILSYHHKIAGILIENVVKNEKIDSSFIGIGLNVNQQEFPDFLPKATSMLNITNTIYDRDKLLKTIIKEFKKVLNKDYILTYHKEIKKHYLDNLYKMQTPAMYKDSLNNVFMGKIIEVSDLGKLVIEKPNETLYEYDLKEISFL